MQIFPQYQIIKDLTQPVRRDLCTGSILRISIHIVLPDLGRGCATQSIQYHIHTVSLPAAFHAPDHGPGFPGHILLLKLSLAVQTVSTVTFSVFAKIFQDILTQAVMGKTVKSHLLQPLLIPFPHQTPGCRIQLLVILPSLNEILVGDHIFPTVEKNTFCRISVTACTSSFLIIALHVLWHIIMNDVPNIRLVDSHSKCIGSYHHMTAVIDKIILVVPAFLIREPCMISGGSDTVPDQFSADLLHHFSGQTVDDPAVIRMLQYVVVYFLVFIFRRFYRKVQILPVESCRGAKRIPKPQKPRDIFSYLFGCRSCKGADHRTLWKLCHKLRDLQITWSEVLSPLGNTVCLIHCDHGNIRTLSKIQKCIGGKPLRCHIDNRVTSCFCVTQSCKILSLCQGAV